MNKNFETIENTSKVYSNGSIWESNNCGSFTIIGKTDRHTIDKRGYPEYKHYLCQFEDGTVVEAKTHEIKNGKVRNPNFPSICDKGYLGEGEWKFYINQKATKEYSLFSGILNRCYNPNVPNYEYYGANGVVLDSKLFNFQTFCNALTKMKNYEMWKNDTQGIWEIDKDILSEKYDINPPIYSEETCMFITKSENIADRNKRDSIVPQVFIAIDPNGEKYEFQNIKEFAREHSLYDTHIGRCIHGKAKQHKGWTFNTKQDAALNNMSIDDLQAMLNGLDE